MTKKWFAGSFFFSILIMFSVVLIFNVGTAQAYYQVQSGIKIICCTKNYTLCLDTEAKKMKNPDTNQLFANYNAALQYDSFNGTELFLPPSTDFVTHKAFVLINKLAKLAINQPQTYA